MPASLPDRLAAHLDKVGSGVTLAELCYQTQASPRDVLDAIAELEEDGRAYPYGWCSADAAANLARDAQRAHHIRQARRTQAPPPQTVTGPDVGNQGTHPPS